MKTHRPFRGKRTACGPPVRTGRTAPRPCHHPAANNWPGSCSTAAGSVGTPPVAHRMLHMKRGMLMRSAFNCAVALPRNAPANTYSLASSLHRLTIRRCPLPAAPVELLAGAEHPRRPRMGSIPGGYRESSKCK